MAIPVDELVTLPFVKDLPKIELHAHLSGSISRQCLHEIWQRKQTEGSLSHSLEDPLLAIPPGKVDYDLKTFFPLFSNYIYNLCSDPHSIQYSTRRVLEDFQDDGVAYLELRTTPRASPENGVSSKSQYIELILDTIDAFTRGQITSEKLGFSSSLVPNDPQRLQSTSINRGVSLRQYKPFPMKTNLILSIDRRNSAEEAAEVVDLAIQYKHRGIVGIDLCGDPAKGDVAIFGPAFARAREHGLGLTLHFAEFASSATQLELDTLLSYQPDRIGHVIHVTPAVQEEIARRKLGLELCLSCNVHAKMITGGIGDHHFGYWKDKECPIALSTDDVGIFCSPLSNEYLLAASHFHLSQSDILQLCRGAAEAIFGSDDEKAYLRSLYDQYALRNMKQA